MAYHQSPAVTDIDLKSLAGKRGTALAGVTRLFHWAIASAFLLVTIMPVDLLAIQESKRSTESTPAKKLSSIPEGLEGLTVLGELMDSAKRERNLELFRSAYLLYESRVAGLAANTLHPDDKHLAGESGWNEEEIVEGKLEDHGDSVSVVLQKSARNLVSWQKKSWDSGNDALPNEWPYELSPDVPAQTGMRIASTAIVCLALVQEPGYFDDAPRKEAVKRSTERLLIEFHENPRLGSRRSDGAVWACIYGLEYFLFVLRKEVFEEQHHRRIQAMAKRLVKRLEESCHGWPAGGWNYTGVEPCKPFMTAAALLVLFQADSQGFNVDVEVVGEALAAIELTRVTAARFAYSGGFIPLKDSAIFDSMRHWASESGSIGRACVSELSLYCSGRSDSGQLRMAIEAFFKHWPKLVDRKNTVGHGGPSQIASYYIMFAHRYVAIAIEALPEDERPALRMKLRRLLLGLRANEGWNESTNPCNVSYCTATGMLALMAVDSGPVPQWCKGEGRSR